MRKLFFPFFAILSLLFLIYLIAPGPESIDDFPALPDSQKSTLSGDTWQEPSLKAFYSDNFRDFVIPFYKNSYESKSSFPFPALKLNYPPEYAFIAIKDQTKSTYLEEITYPFRDSLYINGLEPFEEDGNSRYAGATKMGNEGQEYFTKVVIRYYPSYVISRVIFWFFVNMSFFVLYKMTTYILNLEE